MKQLTAIFCVFLSLNYSLGQIPYGNNPKAGKYVQSDDARIYYEVYGKGDPLLLLHGGYYGYISEYEQYLPDLIENFRVIAVATRGHGKSEIGKQKMSYELFAKDAINVLNREKTDSAVVLGFSDGAITGTILASEHPPLVKKLVSMGGSINNRYDRAGNMEKLLLSNGKEMEKNVPPFLQERKKIMPEPERFAEWYDLLKYAWLDTVRVSDQAAKAVDCPVLIIAGDRDYYARPEGFVEMYNLIPNSQLLILPNANHVSLIQNPVMLNNIIIPFLKL